MIETKEKADVNVEASKETSSPKRILTAHFKPEVANKNEIDNIKSILENVEVVSNEIEENSIKHKHSDSNLTSAIMERMEQLEDQNRF